MSKSEDPPESPPPLDSPELLLPPNIEPTTLCATEDPTPNAKPCAIIPGRLPIRVGSGPAGVVILRLLSVGFGAPRAVVSSVVWFQKYVCPLALSRTSTHGSVDLGGCGTFGLLDSDLTILRPLPALLDIWRKSFILEARSSVTKAKPILRKLIVNISSESCRRFSERVFLLSPCCWSPCCQAIWLLPPISLQSS